MLLGELAIFEHVFYGKPRAESNQAADVDTNDIANGTNESTEV